MDYFFLSNIYMEYYIEQHKNEMEAQQSEEEKREEAVVPKKSRKWDLSHLTLFFMMW